MLNLNKYCSLTLQEHKLFYKYNLTYEIIQIRKCKIAKEEPSDSCDFSGLFYCIDKTIADFIRRKNIGRTDIPVCSDSSVIEFFQSTSAHFKIYTCKIKAILVFYGTGIKTSFLINTNIY